jgi:hypothetical protein
MKFRHVRGGLTLVAVLGLALAGGGAATAAPAIPRPDTGAKQPMIVVLRDQHPELPARSAKTQRQAKTRGDQAPLVAQARQAGASDLKTFSIVNGFAGSMTKATADRLRADPTVAEVVPDRMVPLTPLGGDDRAAIRAQAGLAPAVNKQIPGTCPTDPAKPLLEPEALQTTHTAYQNPATPQAQNLATGKGVTVAWIADGLDPHNPDFIRPDGTPVFTDYQDFSGTDPSLGGVGAEAFGDASSIAAQGRQTYDLSTWVNAANPLPKGCNITVRGVAPGASLVGLNVFGSSNLAINSVLIQAIEYAVTVDNVDVINESFGGNSYPTEGTDPTALADDAAVAAGVTVVSSTGDAGPTNTIGSPAVDPNVISVAGVTNYRSVAQNGYGGVRAFATSWASDNSSALSSGGITARGRVPDVVAPGEDGWAVCTADPVRFAGCTSFNNEPANLELFGGTSESSPLVAGAAALVIEAYKKTHNGNRPAPRLVKQILTSTATDLGLPATQQGAGEVDTFRAVRLAMSVGTSTPQGDGLMVTTPGGDTQLTAEGAAGSTVDLPLTVTNEAPFTQTVSGHGRILGRTLSDVKSSIPLDVTSPSSPSFLDGIANAAGPVVRRYASTTFTVPPGADHLEGQLAWPGGGANGQSAVRLALIGPNGEYESHSYPQGNGNHGQVDIRYPAPGTWTAVFFASASAAGFHGTVAYEFTATKYVDFGGVSPASLTLKPGQSGTFHVKAKLGADAGDVSAAVQLDTSFRGRTSVPLTLRTLLGDSFTGLVTGGNGRGNPGAQTQTFAFDVPKGKRDLGIDLRLLGDPNQLLSAALMGPDGQVLSLSTNQTVDAAGNVVATGTLQGYVRAPAAGRWVLFLNLNNPAAGTSLTDRFVGHLRYNLVDVKASGVPHGTVKAGKPITVTVTVHNTGVAPEEFFADPRLTSTADYQLVALPGTEPTLPLPFPSTAVGPVWLVPTESSALTIQQSSTIPADFDANAYNNGVPEAYGTAQGLTASATVTAGRVTQGTWTAAPTPIGPTNGPVSGTATLGASVRAQAFDGAATSSTGDFWLAATQANPPAFTPLLLQPGQSGTITVTINPTGSRGTKVSGVVYVDDFSGYLFGGDELAALPYSYTIG